MLGPLVWLRRREWIGWSKAVGRASRRPPGWAGCGRVVMGVMPVEEQVWGQQKAELYVGSEVRKGAQECPISGLDNWVVGDLVT